MSFKVYIEDAHWGFNAEGEACKKSCWCAVHQDEYGVWGKGSRCCVRIDKKKKLKIRQDC